MKRIGKAYSWLPCRRLHVCLIGYLTKTRITIPIRQSDHRYCGFIQLRLLNFSLQPQSFLIKLVNNHLIQVHTNKHLIQLHTGHLHQSHSNTKSNMLSVQNISSGISAILYLSTVPLVGAFTIGVKLAYLVPLLIKWNNPHLLSSESTKRSTFQTKNGESLLSQPYI
jgi:hypothetical protein